MWRTEGHVLDGLNLFEKVPSEQKPGQLKEVSRGLVAIGKNG